MAVYGRGLQLSEQLEIIVEVASGNSGDTRDPNCVYDNIILLGIMFSSNVRCICCTWLSHPKIIGVQLPFKKTSSSPTLVLVRLS